MKYIFVTGGVVSSLGKGLTVRAIRVRTGIQSDVTGSNADLVAADLPAAVQIILNAKS